MNNNIIKYRSNDLHPLFNPDAVAVIGASERPNTVGMKIWRNLMEGGYQGRLYPVNPFHASILGKKAYPSILDIESPIDLAIIITKAETIPSILKQCAQKRIRFAVIISAGFAESGHPGKLLEISISEIAKHEQIRIIGPNCLGVLFPNIHLNATFTNSHTILGNVALVSQSGALCASILDWADAEKLGFSAMISLGNMIDLDFGDILEYLALDPKTHSILLYIESIHDSQKFMHTLSIAAKLKPVIVIKGGRTATGIKAAISHTAALSSRDDVFQIALKRAGAVQVETVQQLFAAAEILSRNFKFQGDKLVIITNGGGAGVLAADHAAKLKICLSELNQETISQFRHLLPSYWSYHNPIDILGDATKERYQATLSACLEDRDVEAVLVILVPVVTSDPVEVAKGVIEIAKTSNKPILTVWLGKTQVQEAQNLFQMNEILNFETAETALEAFSYLTEYYHNRELLAQVSSNRLQKTRKSQHKANITRAQHIIDTAEKENRKVLSTIESKAILALFGIPVTQTCLTKTADEALLHAESIGFPVVMKIASNDITHKQEVFGVKLNIMNSDAVLTTYQDIMESTRKIRPNAKISGVTVEPTYKHQNNRELLIGMFHDPVFGPVLSFGMGGAFVEIIDDIALTLPPLNPYLARQLIARTRVAAALAKFRNLEPIKMEALEKILLQVGEMISELPNVRELDINPLIANDEESIAVDARIVIF